ncbi:MAG TPA: DUF2271 domain-containing protein [Pseudomonadaceae bacterium]|nr:DUF2271 domain-containing protein [Pseudomonadaceae bacterium]
MTPSTPQNLLVKRALLVLGIQLGSSAVLAQTLDLTFEIPTLNVAEYHRPYVAVWVAREDQSVAANLAVLYDLKLANNEGQKWLKDLRQWWRRTGRALEMPVDGVAGATRIQGKHEMQFGDKAVSIPAGHYRLVVEVVREVGGRELLEIPFQWPPQAEQLLNAQGKEEIGSVTLALAP